MISIRILSRVIIALFLTLMTVSFVPGTEKANSTIVFTHVNVIPMDSERVIEDCSVLIEDGFIHQIQSSSSFKVPEFATEIDAKGKYLIPALSDMHVHLEGQAWNIMYPPGSGYSEKEIVYEDLLFMYLAHGITTIDVMSAFPEHIAIREQIQNKELIGPRMVLSRMIDGTGKAWPPPISTWINNEEEARQAVIDAHKLGYDRIKVYSFLDEASYKTILSTAKDLDMPVDGHIPHSVGVEGVITEEQNMIAHSEELMKFASDFNPEQVDYYSSLIAESDTWLTSTLVTSRNLISLLDFPEQELSKPGVEYLHPQGMDIWTYIHTNLYAPIPEEQREYIRSGFESFQLPFITEFHRKGGKLLAGTDALIPSTLPGSSLHDELEELVNAGLSPYESLRVSTTNSHLFLEEMNQAGTIEVGKMANLVLLEENPLNNIAHARKIAGVMTQGRWIPKTQIDQRLDEINRILWPIKNHEEHSPMKNLIISISFLMILCLAAFAQDLSSGLLERSQVPEKYKWDVSDVYPGQDEWQADFQVIEQKIIQYDNFRGKLGDSAQILLKCLQFDDKLKERLEYLWLYAKLNRDVEMHNEKIQAMWSDYNSLNSRVEAARSFMSPEIISIPESTMERFMAEESALHLYAHHLATLLRKADHTLSPEREDFLAKLSPILENPYNVFGALVYAELPFPVIEDDRGEPIQMNRTNSWRARSSQDRKYRKAGYQGYYNSLEVYQSTLASNLSGFIEGKVLLARTRNYHSALEASLDRFSIPVEVYTNLIESTGNNLAPCHRWMQMKKELLGLDTLKIYDTRVAIFPAAEINYSWEEAEALTYKSLDILGEEYLGPIREAYQKRWIDVFPNKGKETGGYSSGPAGPHPYVKMNWGGGLFDFYTLVHELGHFVHSMKVISAQPMVYREYPPFISEVASTTAENVSQVYLIEHATTPEEKLYQMEKYLDNFVLYVYGSCMMAEFEWLIYEMVERGESLQAGVLNEMYAALLAKYYGPAVHIEKTDSYAWMEYPHYYLDYYLYSYATSFSASVQIAMDLASKDETAREGFMDFLRTGNSEYPVESLRKAGVDMCSPLPYEAVTLKMNELLDEMEQLIANMN